MFCWKRIQSRRTFCFVFQLPIPLLLIHLLLRQQFTSAIPILNKGNYPPAENPVPAPAPSSQTKIEAPGKNKSDYENIDQQKGDLFL